MTPTNPPSDAINITTPAALEAAIQAAGTGVYLYAYTSVTNQSPAIGTEAAVKTHMRDNLDLFSGQDTFTAKVEFIRGAEVYSSTDLATKIGVKLAQDTELVLYSNVVKTNQFQLFWKIAAGTYAGKYITFEEIRPPHSSL